MRFTSPSIAQYKKLKYWNSIFFLNKYSFISSSIKDSVLLSYIYGMFNIDKSKNKFNFFLKNGFILSFTRLIKFYKTFIWLIYFNKIVPIFFHKKRYKDTRPKWIKVSPPHRSNSRSRRTIRRQIARFKANFPKLSKKARKKAIRRQARKKAIIRQAIKQASINKTKAKIIMRKAYARILVMKKKKE